MTVRCSTPGCGRDADFWEDRTRREAWCMVCARARRRREGRPSNAARWRFAVLFLVGYLLTYVFCGVR